MIFFDTESIGFYGPTVLIQWARDDGPIHLHNIWTEPVYKTLRLIELMMEEELCGFNLAHDSFHINRTYCVLKELPLSTPPKIADYRAVEQTDKVKDTYCCKPKASLDLMLVGKKGEFQSAMKQKDIVLKKVPKIVVPHLLKRLYNEVQVPDIYFKRSKRGYKWEVLELHRESGKEVTPEQRSKAAKGEIAFEIDKDFVNLRLRFNPSGALKDIVEYVYGKAGIECETKTIDDLRPLPKAEEYSYWPTFGGWVDVAREHIWAWTNDPERLKYAKDDVVYLRVVREYLIENGYDVVSGDDDSELAWSVGAMHWRGYNVDLEATQRRLVTVRKALAKAEVNFNSHSQVLNYLREPCDEMEALAIPDTRKETLESIANDKEWEEDNPAVHSRCNKILKWRHLNIERDLLEKLLRAKRLHVQFKVIGTKSNRMAGGGESFVTNKGSINPQGIKKSPHIRALFLLAWEEAVLCGGDFDAFEVSIADAEYNDPALRQDLESGKKIHALYASAMYDLEYEQIMRYKEEGESHPNGWYARGKRGFFGKLYGAQDKKQMEVFGLEEEQIHEGNRRFFERYKGAKHSQDRVYQDHMALRQPDGPGTRVLWKDPKQYCESFLGFRRYFTLEYSICRTLFKMAEDLPEEIEQAGKNIRLIRRDRLQTGAGACRSALYAAAFNIQSQIMRSAVNHKIQSPGGQITKGMGRRLWDLQPSGVKRWRIMLINIHDELMACCSKKYGTVREAEKIVKDYINSKREKIPLLAMKWKKHLLNWSKK